MNVLDEIQPGTQSAYRHRMHLATGILQLMVISVAFGWIGGYFFLRFAHDGLYRILSIFLLIALYSNVISLILVRHLRKS